MPLIEAALAFAITMLALSLVVSTFVELIHRIFAMREAGLKYMLGQMFDQVLAKYVTPAVEAKFADPALKANLAGVLGKPLAEITLEDVYKDVRDGFVERMSANRAPMGVTPKATPTGGARHGLSLKWWQARLWNGRDLATLTPAEFMERLGSIDIGAVIKEGNTAANNTVFAAKAAAKAAADLAATTPDAANLANAAATAAGEAAADVIDPVLKDVAQKFDAFGKEAGAYFEGRARLLSVAVAMVLALAAHVDAFDLFRTYLRDPNARAKVIEQSEAVTAQYKAVRDAADAVKKIAPDPNATTPDPNAPAASDVKTAIEKFRTDTLTAIDAAKTTVKQYADLGVPLGWSPERIDAAKFSQWGWFCPANRADGAVRFWSPDCKLEERTVWLAVPTVASLWFYLLLGGLLIGLGSPFWYDVVTGLTSLRNAAGGKAGVAPAPPGGAATPQAAANAQPVTPAGAFKVSSGA